MLTAALACDRSTSSQDSSIKSALPPPKPDSAELTTVVPLIPRRPTHLTVSPQGNLYYVQELPAADRMHTTTSSVESGGGDMLFVAGEGDLPRATQLSSTNILAAMQIDAAA